MGQNCRSIKKTLAGKFFTKRVLEVYAVARTFKPLWKPISELKIRDIEENVLLFEFEDVLDLEQVREFEPGSYHKHMVVFQKTVALEDVPLLEFAMATFWVQIHNVPERSLTQTMGELVRRSTG